jgi:TRAP-type mannitol/chloroaromatic compound transport system substrate-binding protein
LDRIVCFEQIYSEQIMNRARRSFLTGLGAAAAIVPIERAVAKSSKYRWRMISRWSPTFPNQFAAAQRLANRIATFSGGELSIEVLPPPENEPTEATLKAVRDGSIEMCRSLAYHWRSQSKAFDFFFVAPFGFTQDEMNAWLRYFGGQELWDQAYASFGVKAFPVGSLGAQSFGWMRQDVKGLSDLKGLRFRTTGLGVEILSRLGLQAINLPPNQIVPAVKANRLDAFELVGPQVDLHFKLHEVASFYYFPSYNQPSGMVELVVNQAKYEALPKSLQEVITIATQAEHDQGLAEANAGNARALQTLVTQHQVQVRQLPQDILIALGNASGEILADLENSGDSITQRTIQSFKSSRQLLMAWSKESDRSFLNARTLPFRY